MFIDLKRSIFCWISIENWINPNSSLSLPSIHSMLRVQSFNLSILSLNSGWISMEKVMFLQDDRYLQKYHRCWIWFSGVSISHIFSPMLHFVYRIICYCLHTFDVLLNWMRLTKQIMASQTNIGKGHSVRKYTLTHIHSLSDSINNAFSYNVFFYLSSSPFFLLKSVFALLCVEYNARPKRMHIACLCVCKYSLLKECWENRNLDAINM